MSSRNQETDVANIPETSEEPGWEVPTTEGEPAPTLPDYLHPEDPDDEWTGRPKRTGLRLGAPTAALLALLLLAGGFWGGALSEKHHNPSSSSSSALSALARNFAASRGASGTRGSGGTAGAGAGGFAGGSATTGLVTAVKGNILYVTDSNGNLIKVTVGPSTSVTRTASSTLAGLQPGDTVVVSGSKGSNGTVSATAVRAVGPGVSLGGGANGVGAGGAGTGGGAGGAGGSFFNSGG